MNIPRHAHVLVIDGAKSLFFRNTGSAQEPSLTVEGHREQVSLATSEQGSDAPGTSHSSVGNSRSSVEQTDFHQQDEDRFAIAAADMLKREVLAGKVDALIIVAAPKTLGVLRKHLHGEVEKRIVGEIAKDLAGRPTDEITAAILSH
jgi:protein required for attachment to host cells